MALRTLLKMSSFSRISVRYTTQHLLICLLLSQLLVAQESVLQMVQKSPGSSSEEAIEPQGLHEGPGQSWGLPDATADVGTIFRYVIPSDAFSEPAVQLTVSEMGGSGLPSWLYYNSTSRVIEGVATSTDLSSKPLYHIEVKASLTSGSITSDTFSIRLREHSAVSQEIRKSSDKISGAPEPVLCPLGSSVTSASLLLDVDLSKLSPVERVVLLRALAQHIGLSEQALRYTVSDIGGAIDSSALVAGPGDVSLETTGSTTVRWEVGCGSVVTPHMDLLQTVETSAKDGSMHKAVSYGVIGWYVTNKKPLHEGKRVKRQARLPIMPTATLSRAVPPPSSRPVPTRVIPIPLPSSQPPENRTRISPTPPRVVETRTSPTPRSSPSPTPSSRSTIQPSVSTFTPSPQPDRTASLPPSTTPKLTKPPPVVPPVKINLMVGDILNYVIPRDAFTYFNPSEFLVFTFTFQPGEQYQESWVSYDSVNHKFTGIPSERNAGQHKYIYLLTANSHATNRTQTIQYEFTVKVLRTTSITYEAYVTLDENHEEFMDGVEKSMEVGSKIASAYGDKDAWAISVLRIVKGSVVYVWSNRTTFSGNTGYCPAKEIDELLDRVVSAEGKVEEGFLQALKPYRVRNAGGEGVGVSVCSGVVPKRFGQVDDLYYEVQPKTARSDGSAALVYALIAVIITIIIVLIVVIIWCVKRKNRNKKYECNEEKRNGSAPKKRVPVILMSDLDDRSNGGGSRSKGQIFRGPSGSSDTLDSVGDRKPMPPGYSSPSVQRASEQSRPLLSGDDNGRPTGVHQSTFKSQPNR